MEDIYDSLDNKEHVQVLGIYLDLKKAFDTVDHFILLWKFNNYGIRGIVHDWFASYYLIGYNLLLLMAAPLVNYQ